MEYMDEQILKLKKFQMDNEKRDHIPENMILINGEYIQLEEVSLFSNSCTIMLPSNFVDLPEEIVKRKYLMENRPQIIKSNMEGSVNITFSYLKVPLEEDQVLIVLEEMKTAIKNVNPSNVFYNQDFCKVRAYEAYTIGWFDYKSYAIDSKVYNLMFLAPMKSGTILGTLNCSIQEWEEWKEAVLRILDTFKMASSAYPISIER